MVDDLSASCHFDTFVSEVSAHIAAAIALLFPIAGPFSNVGGQDSKAMLFDGDMQIWVAKMSGICAAGTGAFLDSVAAKLSVPVEELADRVNYDSTLELSSVCAVLSADLGQQVQESLSAGRRDRGRLSPRPERSFPAWAICFSTTTGPSFSRAGSHRIAPSRTTSGAITGNRILIPELSQVMGALGAAQIARDCWQLECHVHSRRAVQSPAQPRAERLESGNICRTPSARSENRPPCGFT